MAGQPATNGSAALRDFVPDVDAVPVARLRDAGAVIVGKTNNPEFCYRGYTDNAVFGLTRNPWSLDRTPGGSSGGAGASVAYGATPVALGTDGGGSIRIPSAFCGVPGHKPSFGLVPKLPGFRGWPSLSVDGPLASSVRDLVLALRIVAGAHPADPLSWPVPLGDEVPLDWTAAAGRGVGGSRLGAGRPRGADRLPGRRGPARRRRCPGRRGSSGRRAADPAVERHRPARGLRLGGTAPGPPRHRPGHARDHGVRPCGHGTGLSRRPGPARSLHPDLGDLLRAVRRPAGAVDAGAGVLDRRHRAHGDRRDAGRSRSSTTGVRWPSPRT